jgi:hypothetical protein
MNHAPPPPGMSELGCYRLLKNGSFLVLALQRPEGTVVCKLAKNNSEKLRREIDRLALLRAKYPLLSSWMPKFRGEGWLNSPLMGRQLYYLLDFVPGQTLGDALMKGELQGAAARDWLAGLTGRLLDHMAEHETLPPSQDFWLGGQLRSACERIKGLELTGPLVEAPDLIINGVKLHALAENVQRLLDRPAVRSLALSPPPVSALGHWNFHSQNILIAPERPGGFAIIDPDSSLAVCDPMFGLARLLYSFVHDCSEADSYEIASDPLPAFPRNGWRITATLQAPPGAIEAYRPLYLGLFGQEQTAQIGLLDPRLAEPREKLRLDLNLLLCLLRGVAVNHEPSLRPIDGDLSRFRHAGLFLLLNAMALAQELAHDAHG